MIDEIVVRKGDKWLHYDGMVVEIVDFAILHDGTQSGRSYVGRAAVLYKSVETGGLSVREFGQFLGMTDTGHLMFTRLRED